ncbi:hypothetical protein BDQ17DRAFT_1329274 [Cyathus striatus]|nr:hypothetical protein BDQ17DRAFT_1329274 [Cyathus striatus]
MYPRIVIVLVLDNTPLILFLLLYNLHNTTIILHSVSTSIERLRSCQCEGTCLWSKCSAETRRNTSHELDSFVRWGECEAAERIYSDKRFIAVYHCETENVTKNVINHKQRTTKAPPESVGKNDNATPNGSNEKVNGQEAGAAANTEDKVKQADLIKEQRNVVFKAGRYGEAVDLYSKAIASQFTVLAVYAAGLAETFVRAII